MRPADMALQWVCTVWCAAFLVVAGAAELTDEEYYQMPRLFELDDFEECFASRRGAFCVGSFDLLPHGNDTLLRVIQLFSEDVYHFNHSHIHRGYCITSRCAHIQGATLRGRFEKCVDNITRSEYGLETNLTRLEYCRAARAAARPADRLDLAFAGLVVLLLLGNVLGTAYHLLRNKDNKPNKYLIAWSLKANWTRLTADYADGDPRLAALKPIQGMKALTLILIMLAHTVLAYHITYIYNPLFLEKASHHPMSAYFQNGTSIVQTFILVSNFLLAYNLLLHADGAKRRFSLRMLPQCFMHRLVRILPVYVFVLGAAMTWWAAAGDGPLWAPLVGGESARCRDKWWTQLLFINNLVRPDVKCLIHTWFLAVDMQLYVVSCALTLALGAGGRRRAVMVLGGALAAALGGNLLAAYCLHLRPMVTLMFPEHMRIQFEGERSFTWLYQAPWDSLPAALIGVALAFLHHRLQRDAVSLKDCRRFVAVYRLTVPSMFAWVWAGYWLKGCAHGGALALYAAADRPVFAALTAAAMLGFIHQLDSAWWRFLSWRGWAVLGRMSLCVYLVHWLFALSQLAASPVASVASVQQIAGHFLWTVFVTYWCAVPLHLLVELPAQRCLLALAS